MFHFARFLCTELHFRMLNCRILAVIKLENQFLFLLNYKMFWGTFEIQFIESLNIPSKFSFLCHSPTMVMPPKGIPVILNFVLLLSFSLQYLLYYVNMLCSSASLCPCTILKFGVPIPFTNSYQTTLTLYQRLIAFGAASKWYPGTGYCSRLPQCLVLQMEM